MRKLVLNLSDHIYELLRLEAMEKQISIAEVIADRIVHKNFSDGVLDAYSSYIDQEVKNLMEE